MNTLFPIFVKADQINILLVGGGEIAEEKLYFLLKNSPQANVHIITKEVSAAVRLIVAEHENLTLEIRPFKDSDVNQSHLIIAATNNPELNDYLRWLATHKHILLNAADKSSLCDFYLGGVVTKGDLKLAISTNGKSPIMAKRLREFFESELPDSIEDVIEDLRSLRTQLNGTFDRKLKTLNELTKVLIEEGQPKN